jgi:hypothetical protein
VNCVSMTCLACCSFIVSVKLSSNELSVWGCMVFVKSRYFSTQFSSFLMHSSAPGGNGTNQCFLGLNVVTKVWRSCSPGSGSSSSYSPGMCRINACLLGLRYLLQVKSFACLIRSFGSIVVSVARNGTPLMNFVGQLISGLNSRNHR